MDDSQRSNSHGSGRLVRGNGHARIPTVDEALPFTPFTSILPFHPGTYLFQVSDSRYEHTIVGPNWIVNGHCRLTVGQKLFHHHSLLLLHLKPVFLRMSNEDLHKTYWLR